MPHYKPTYSMRRYTVHGRKPFDPGDPEGRFWEPTHITVQAASPRRAISAARRAQPTWEFEEDPKLVTMQNW